MAFTEKRFLPAHELDSEMKNRLIVQLKERLSLKEDIVFAYVHGSFIKSGSFRDIDIAVFISGKRDLNNVESDLSAELTAVTGFETEVRIINEAPVAFQMAALRDGVLLFSRNEDVRTDFIEKVGKGYIEYAHFRNLFMGCEGVR